MKRSKKLEMLQAVSCLLCFILAWAYLDDIGASEFSGGWLTGPLFKMADYGCTLFFLSLFLTFFLRRIAGVTALVASLLCMPFYLYFLAPGPFRRVFKGEYSVPLQTSFVWNTWAIAGILSLLLAIVVSLPCLAAADCQSIPAPENGDTT
jgi:hypothetical protein